MPVAVRRAVFARSGGLCDRCGAWVGLDGAEGHAHHRVLSSKVDTLEVLVGLCPGCHEDVHGSPAAARAGGWIVPSWGAPATVAVRRFDGRWYLPAGKSWKRTSKEDE